MDLDELIKLKICKKCNVVYMPEYKNEYGEEYSIYNGNLCQKCYNKEV